MSRSIAPNVSAPNTNDPLAPWNVDVVTTETDTPAAWLSAGQALARVLLLACAHRVSASFLNQPLESDVLRPQFREELALSGFPQMLLRLGYGPDTRPTPRRDVREVLM